MSFFKNITSFSVVIIMTQVSLASYASSSKQTVIPLDTPVAFDVVNHIVNYKGAEATHVAVDPNHKSVEGGGCDNCTFLLVDKKPFRNGTIEIDLAGKPSEGAPAWARGFVGVVFRIQGNKREKYEGFYLRPMNALEQEPRRNNTIQYFAYPDHPWHKLRENFPGKYEGYADVKPGEWHTLRIDVSGNKAVFSIDGTKVLTVDNLLNGSDLSGGIGLFTEPATDAYFKNLRVLRK